MPVRAPNHPAGQLLKTRDLQADGAEAQGVYSPGAPTATVTIVASATSVQTLKAANVLRRRLLVYNDSSAILYAKEGSGASSTDFSFPIPANTLYEFPTPEPYSGLVTGAWASVNGQARVTEET